MFEVFGSLQDGLGYSWKPLKKRGKEFIQEKNSQRIISTIQINRLIPENNKK